MADQQTVYEVITRFLVDDRSSGPTQKIGNTAKAASEHFDTLRTTAADAAFKIGGTLVAGFAALWGTFKVGEFAVEGIRSSVENLEEEFQGALRLAGQFNIAMRFDKNPTRNFVQALREGKQLMAEIGRESAPLGIDPGRTGAIAGAILAPALFAGRSKSDVRRLAEMLVQSDAVTGGQITSQEALQLLSGHAYSRSPLFQQLSGSGLLPGKASAFNALTAAKRFELLDKALAHLVDNPAFRNASGNSFASQFSTTRQLLFGAQGIGGQLLAEPLEHILSALKSFNEGLAKWVPAIVGAFDLIGSGFKKLFIDLPLWLAKKILDPTGLIGAGVGYIAGGAGEYLRHSLGGARARRRAGEDMREFSGRFGAISMAGSPGFTRLFGLLTGFEDQSMRDPTKLPPGVLHAAILKTKRQMGGKTLADVLNPGANQISLDQVQGLLLQNLSVSLSKNGKPTLNHPQFTNNNTFNIKLDLKSDVSPEAIALKFEDALERVARSPRRAARGVPRLTARPSAGG